MPHRAPGKTGEHTYAQEADDQVLHHTHTPSCALHHANYVFVWLLICPLVSCSPSQFDSILAEGVPAVTDLHKLEFE